MSAAAKGGLTADAYVLKANGEREVDPPPAPATLNLRPCRHGLMLYFPHDFYLGGALDRYGEYAELESELLLKHVNDGDIVVEVGANMGCHTVALAQKVGNAGRVIAFEPQRVIFQMMCGNLAVNGIWNVITERVALGNSVGMVFVPPVDYAAAGNFGGVAMSTTAGEPVSQMTLDIYKLSRCNLIKIDVEGMEQAVLEGARETIAAHRPILYVENDRPDKAAELIHYLRGIHYDLYWHLPPLYNPDNFRGFKENVYGDVVSINMLCYPHERGLISQLPPVQLPNEGGMLQ